MEIYHEDLETLKNKEKHIERVMLFRRIAGEILKDYDEELRFRYIEVHGYFEPIDFDVKITDVSKIEEKIPNCFV